MEKRMEERIKNLERIVTIDLGGRGVIHKLYEQSVSQQGGYPSLLAAKALRDQLLEKRRYALITTGSLVPPTFMQETDGPLGAIALARSIDKFTQINSIITAEEEAIQILKSLARVAGLNVVPLSELGEAKHAISLVKFPKSKAQAEKKGEEIIVKYGPSIVISVEKASPNEVGIYHNSRGKDITNFVAKIEYLMKEARGMGIQTIGIGDGGNEVGMGMLKETVKEVVPYGSECKCNCGKGIAADISTNILVPAAVSNWGAYSIIAALSILSDEDFLHTSKLEGEMLKEAARMGSIDGRTGQPNRYCDGISPSIHASIVEVIKGIIKWEHTYI